MKAIRRPNQYLRLRGDIWHYVRRVPKAVSHIDDRTLIYRSLDTDSRRVARQRRDLCANEVEIYVPMKTSNAGARPCPAVSIQRQEKPATAT